jgi:hypothetical protein
MQSDVCVIFKEIQPVTEHPLRNAGAIESKVNDGETRIYRARGVAQC